MEPNTKPRPLLRIVIAVVALACAYNMFKHDPDPVDQKSSTSNNWQVISIAESQVRERLDSIFKTSYAYKPSLSIIEQNKYVDFAQETVQQYGLDIYYVSGEAHPRDNPEFVKKWSVDLKYGKTSREDMIGKSEIIKVTIWR